MIKYSSKNSQDKMVQIQSIQSSTRALSILYIKNQGGEGIKEKKRLSYFNSADKNQIDNNSFNLIGLFFLSSVSFTINSQSK